MLTDPKTPMPGAPAGMNKPVSTLTRKIVIPEIPAGADGSALDLGELELN